MSIAVNSHRAIVFSILLGFAPLFVGCGKRNGVERFPVHGAVKLANGEKLSGTISFLPARGPAATTVLTEGSYKFDRHNGPVAGKQTVIVKRGVSGPRVFEEPARKKANLGTKTEWNESTDVSDDGQYLHDFTLKD